MILIGVVLGGRFDTYTFGGYVDSYTSRRALFRTCLFVVVVYQAAIRGV